MKLPDRNCSALILLGQVQSWVFTAKCSEPQVGTSNGMEGGSGTYGSMGGAKIFIFPLPYFCEPVLTFNYYVVQYSKELLGGAY